jgi:hypothetical protein
VHVALKLHAGLKNIKLTVKLLVNRQDTCIVAAAVSVVHGGPHRNTVFIFKPILVALHTKLVGSGNQFQTIVMIEF